MSMYKTEPLDSDLDDDSYNEHIYPCACQNPQCIADDRDHGNFQIRGDWYASDCKVANAHPDVVGDVVAALMADDAQVDAYNQTRR